MRAAFVVFLSAVLVSAVAAYQPESNVTRGIYCHSRGVISTDIWGYYGRGGHYVTDEKHGGASSLKCDYADGGPGSGAGVSQQITFDQETPKPIKIAGWSKAEGVQPGAAYEYSIYLDLRYADGTAWYMQIAPFKAGTHDWEYAERVITPEKPVKSASVHVFLREKPGTVWFDEVFVGEVDGDNLLKNPGFEQDQQEENEALTDLIAQYEDLNANAMHIYLSPNSPLWESDLLDKHYDGVSPMTKFLATLKRHGIGVWVTTGSLSQPFKGVDDPNFPAYYCPNEKWGENWVNVLGDLAREDIAGISLVPDEYNYTNSTLKRAFAKHSDEAVRTFYEEMPWYCNGPGCQALFQEAFGTEMPDLHEVQQTDDWRKYINFRYMTTTEWMRKGAEAVKQANPDCRADSLICVTPVCSDRWWSVGVAWDQVGYGTKIDFLTTDPYILLHNYLGDSTHWYVTETCERLSGAHPLRQCGSVLEASRLRPQFRELDPVEVYGSALSSVFHGARELAWWHHSHITGLSGTPENAEKTYAIVKGTYQLLSDVDPWLTGLQPLKRVALLHSRASEDWWRFYSTGEPADCLTHEDKDARYASRAQVEVLMHYLRTNTPVDLYYLESVTAQQLADYPLVVVPFPFAIDDDQVAMLRELADEGKAIVVMSEVGTLTAGGEVRDTPALLDLLGLDEAPTGEQTGRLIVDESSPLSQIPLDDEVTTYSSVAFRESVDTGPTVNGVPVAGVRSQGDGFVAFLAGEFGVGLPESYDNEVRSREQRVYPPRHRQTHRELLTSLCRLVAGEASVAGELSVAYDEDEPEFPDDVEVVMATNGDGDLVCFCANWTQGAATMRLNIDATRFDPAQTSGRAITPDAAVRSIDRVPTSLASQEACVFRVPRR